MKRRYVGLVIALALVSGLVLIAMTYTRGGGAERPLEALTPQSLQAEEGAGMASSEAEPAHSEAEAEEGGQGEEAHPEGAQEEDHGPGEHVGGQHDVPPEAEALENPVPATEESIALGAQIYAQNCAVCHGANGEGDGPAAAGLPKPPANLHADHVQANSDGALFWIITHGKPNSPMPPWDDVLTEEERWHVVNFLRTFGGAQEAGDAH